jgi:transposase-like protein
VSQLTLREKEESHLTVVEEVHNVSSANAQGPVASAIKTRGSRRPRLSLDEKREIARLYADPSTSTSEICARLGIGESSLYRIVQLHGLPLRGRTASSTSPGTTQPTVAPNAAGAKSVTRRRRRRIAPVARRPRVETPSDAPATKSASAPTATRRTRTAGMARSRELVQFVVTYLAVQTLQAASALDALQQAQARGATEVTSIVRIA